MTRTARSSARFLLLAGLLMFLGAGAHAEGDGHHDGDEGASVPATPPPAPSNNIVACFGSPTKDPLATCASGVSAVLQSVSFGASTPVSGLTGGGVGVGKTIFQPLTIVKKLDRISPILLKDEEQGSHFQVVTIGFYDPAGKLAHLFEFRLVTVESVNIANAIAPGGEALESIGLVYGAFLETL